MGVKAYHCDNVTQEFEDSQLLVVKEWVEKRDTAIKQFEAERQDMKKSYDELKSEYEGLKKKCDELKSEMDKAKGKCDALEAELSTRKDSDQVGEYLKQRRKLERIVTARLDSIDDDQLDSMSDRQIKETLIKANYDFDDLSSRSDEAIEGMFEMAIKHHDGKKFETKKQSLATVATPRNDEDNFDMLSVLREKATQSRQLLMG